MLFLLAILATILAFTFSVTAKKRGKLQEANFALIGSFIALVLSLIQVLTVIPAGSVGVIDFLGNVSSETLKSGVNIVNPLAEVVKFNIKTQELKETMSVPSQEGLTVQLEISLLFSLDPDNASKIYKSVGPNYADIILIPQFRSVVRGVTAKYDARALYTASREILAKQIKDELAGLVGPRGILIETVPFRQIVLPPGLTASIEEKLKAEQESQRMQFILKKEEQEADRKRIEAKGIADFQEIVAKGISENLLKWKGIEATEKLANSNNAKIVVIGSGKDGLPLILGGN